MAGGFPVVPSLSGSLAACTWSGSSPGGMVQGVLVLTSRGFHWRALSAGEMSNESEERNQCRWSTCVDEWLWTGGVSIVRNLHRLMVEASRELPSPSRFKPLSATSGARQQHSAVRPCPTVRSAGSWFIHSLLPCTHRGLVY